MAYHLCTVELVKTLAQGRRSPPWLQLLSPRTLVLLVLLQLLAGGCDEEIHRSVTLSVASIGDAITLDPAAASDNESMQVLVQVFDRLVRYEPGTFKVVPSLAVRWNVTDGGRVWTFKLRKGVRFHDGTPMDADAVVFSFRRQMDPKHPFHIPGAFTYWESTFRQVKNVERVGRYMVRMTLDRPFSPFLANLTMFPASIVSPTAMRKLGRKFAVNPVGTGPYRFVSWNRGNRLTLARNWRYWGGAPKVDRLIYEVIPEAHRRLVSLESGTVDVVHGLAPSDRQIVALHPSLQLTRVRGNNVAYVAMNTQRPPFDDVRVRRAVNHAINKRPIVKLAYQGLATEAIGPIPPTIWSHEREIRRYEYNPTLARKMLERAGYDFNRRLSFHVMSTPRPYVPSPLLVGRMIVRDLTMIGMKVDLVVRPFKEHQRATQQGEHDLCLAGWSADNADPDNFLYVLLDRDNARHGAARNLAMFSNNDLHKLLIGAQQLMSHEKRAPNYRAAQRIVASQAPWVPLAHTDITLAVRRSVRGVRIHPSGAISYAKAVKR